MHILCMYVLFCFQFPFMCPSLLFACVFIIVFVVFVCHNCPFLPLPLLFLITTSTRFFPPSLCIPRRSINAGLEEGPLRYNLRQKSFPPQSAFLYLLCYLEFCICIFPFPVSLSWSARPHRMAVGYLVCSSVGREDCLWGEIVGEEGVKGMVIP